MIKRLIKALRITLFSFLHETKVIFSDSGAILILIIAVFLYPVIYSIAYKNNVLTDINLAIVDMDHTVTSRQLSKFIDASEKTKVFSKSISLNEAKTLFYKNEIKGIVVIPNEFEKNILKGKQTSISLYCDGASFLIYKETLTGAITAGSTLSGGVEIKRTLASGATIKQAVDKQNPLPSSTYMLYNPSAGYGSYIMPGIILLIIQQTLLIGMGMMAGSRIEKLNKKYKFPKMLYMISPMGVVIGKSLTYLMICLFNSIIALVWIYYWFGFPVKGSIFTCLAVLIPFLLAIIFFGLTISNFFRKREHALIFLVFLSPFVLFSSGVSFPTAMIPEFVQKLAMVFPTTSAIPAFLRVQTMGVGIKAVSSEISFLYFLCIIYFSTACLSSYLIAKKRF